MAGLQLLLVFIADVKKIIAVFGYDQKMRSEHIHYPGFVRQISDFHEKLLRHLIRFSSQTHTPFAKDKSLYFPTVGTLLFCFHFYFPPGPSTVTQLQKHILFYYLTKYRCVGKILSVLIRWWQLNLNMTVESKWAQKIKQSKRFLSAFGKSRPLQVYIINTDILWLTDTEGSLYYIQDIHAYTVLSTTCPVFLDTTLFHQRLDFSSIKSSLMLKRHFPVAVEIKKMPSWVTTIFAIIPDAEKVQVIELNTHAKCGAVAKVWKGTAWAGTGSNAQIGVIWSDIDGNVASLLSDEVTSGLLPQPDVTPVWLPSLGTRGSLCLCHSVFFNVILSLCTPKGLPSAQTDILCSEGEGEIEEEKVK